MYILFQDSQLEDVKRVIDKIFGIHKYHIAYVVESDLEDIKSKIVEIVKDVNFSIKLAEKNIGFENNIYTFPYFLTFLLKRFLSEKK